MITEKEYKSVIEDLSSSPDSIAIWQIDLPRVEKTFKLVTELLAAASVVLIVDGTVRQLRWYNFKAWWTIAGMMYDFVTELIEVWKK